MKIDTVIQGDCREILKTLPDQSINCCVTSPPYYGLRDYGMDEQIGLEQTPEEFIQELTEVFREVRRVLRDDGTLWLNMGDSYWGSGSRGYDFTGKLTEASKLQEGSKGTINLSNIPKLIGNVNGYKNKDLIGIPWMLAFALRNDGWYLRQDIIWHKPNPMPESVTDRCTKSHEYIFLMTKKPKYYYDYEAIQEEAKCKDDRRSGGVASNMMESVQMGAIPNTLAQQSFVTITETKNKRDVWSVTTKPCREAHFATFPEDLIEPCILAGCPIGGVVLDPFFGSGTTGRVAAKFSRHYLGIELNPEYIEISNRRTNHVQMTMEGFV